MAARTGRFRPASNSRHDLLQAWILQHADLLPAVGKDKVPQRIQTHVGASAEWFPDVHPMVVLGREGRSVGWEYEPISPAGDPIEAFLTVLDRVGPLAIAVCIEARAILKSPDFHAALTAAGVPSGRAKGQIDYYTDPYRGGNRLVTALGVAVCDHISRSPAAQRALVEDPGAVAQHLTEQVKNEAIAGFAVRAAGDWQVVSHDHVTPATSLARGLALCEEQCPPGRERRQPTEADFARALDKLTGRWIKKAWHHPIDEAGAARLAHTLIDPFFFRLRWKDVEETFNETARVRIARQVRVKLPPDQLDEIVAFSMADGWERLTHDFIDSYLIPEREPDDWALRIRAATTPRGVQEHLKRTNRERQNIHLDAQKRPWEPGTFQPGDVAQVEEDFWMIRDLHLTDTPEYTSLRDRDPRAGETPWGILEIAWLASRLVDAAAEELAGGPKPMMLGAPERELARRWIDERLVDVLHQAMEPGLGQDDKHAEAPLAPPLSIIDHVIADSPAEDDVPGYRRIGLVVECAVRRATVAVLGRRAMDGEDGTPEDEDD